MKIVLFKGGLGNQLFQYALMLMLKEQGMKVLGFDCCGNSHNGFELIKYFNVDLRFCNKLHIFLFFRLCGLPVRLRKWFIADSSNFNIRSSTLFYNDYWQEKKFLPEKLVLSFKQLSLNTVNLNLVKSIGNSESVAIHIRRGDYLKPGNKDVFYDLCESDYYHEAIKHMNTIYTNPRFFIFSNDSEWCKKNIASPNCVYVDWNTGNDSIYDMYLMSKCDSMIIANSTFSFWAAKLNTNASIVIYPRKWFKQQSIDVFPDNWVCI